MFKKQSILSIPGAGSENNSGFTVIEVLIVLAIAGLILLVVFLAAPEVQRSARNRQRNSDAAILLAAVTECMSYRATPAGCDSAAELPITPSDMGAYTGFHFGAPDNSWPAYSTQMPPTIDEPNWLFGLECTPNGSFISSADPKNRWVVAYFLEKRNGIIGRCIEN